MWQHLIVFVIVIAAALYALWRWLPVAWRRGAARRLAAGAQEAGWIDARRAAKISAALGQPSGCAACPQRAGCQGGQTAVTASAPSPRPPAGGPSGG